MRTRTLWFGLVAMVLAVTPAYAGKVDWSKYIDKDAAANTNIGRNAPGPSTAAESEPSPKTKTSKRTARTAKKATKAKSKTKARAKSKQKARRK